MSEEEQRNPNPGEMTRDPEVLLQAIDTVPARLGFVETAELTAAREAVSGSSESRVGSAASYEALRAYQLLGEAVVDQIPDDEVYSRARAQIGLSVAVAVMDRERGDTVRYLQGLLDAYEYAQNMSFNDVLIDVHDEISKYATSAEFKQARGDFEEAADGYIERDQDPQLSDRDRGILNLRLVECYLGQVPADQDPDEQLAKLIQGSIESALAYLEGTPEFERALELLDQVSPQE